MKSENFRIWFFIGTALLFIATTGHALGHYRFYIREGAFEAERIALVRVMKSYIVDKMLFETSMWTLLKAFSMSFSLLFLFAGSINALILNSDFPVDFVQKAALLNSMFWFVSLLLFLILNPAIQPIAICFCAALIFGISYFSAR